MTSFRNGNRLKAVSMDYLMSIGKTENAVFYSEIFSKLRCLVTKSAIIKIHSQEKKPAEENHFYRTVFFNPNNSELLKTAQA